MLLLEGVRSDMLGMCLSETEQGGAGSLQTQAKGGEAFAGVAPECSLMPLVMPVYL